MRRTTIPFEESDQLRTAGDGVETCGEASDDELDQLDEAPGIEEHSRLGCQCVPNGTKDVVVDVPNWNRNLVREAPH